MEYESNILKRLVEKYGVIGNPSYVSEIIKQFITQGQKDFPQLFTYQADWLSHIDKFGLTSGDYTMTYTGQSVYIPNTKGKPVKRAILTGNTERINEQGFYQSDNSIFHLGYFEQGTYGGNTGGVNQKTESVTRIRSINSYKVPQGTYSVELNSGFEGVIRGINASNKVLFTTEWSSSPTTSVTNDTTSLCVILRKQNQASISVNDLEEAYISSSGFDFANITLTNVKMPVLTTTGKNLFNKENMLINCALDTDTGEIIENWANFNTSDFIKVEKNRPIFIPSTGSSRKVLYDINKNYVKNVSFSGDKVFVADVDGYIRITMTNIDYDSFQIEYGTQATSYEPYKSNILTVNQDVELRGISDVQDTLDCLTGECVIIIEERELNGSENWSSNGSSNGVYKYYCNTYTDAKGNATTSIGDKVEFVNVNGGESLKGEVCLTHTTSTGKIQFASTISTTANFKAWLKENPVIVQYERANPVTKTVGVVIKDQDNQSINKLSTFEGGTHISSSSDTFKPVFEVEVVEDIEKLILECSSTGNTM